MFKFSNAGKKIKASLQEALPFLFAFVGATLFILIFYYLFIGIPGFILDTFGLFGLLAYFLGFSVIFYAGLFFFMLRLECPRGHLFNIFDLLRSVRRSLSFNCPECGERLKYKKG